MSSIIRSFIRVSVLGPASLFSGRLKKRLRSEAAYPLKNQYLKKEYDAIFHVSSQGEWQQVRPVFEEFRDRSILILYSSESLTKEMSLLVKTVDIAMLPILSFRLTQNVSHLKTKNFFMVRYDFFPELMMLSKKTHSVLIAATLKNKKLSFTSRYYWKKIYSSFNTIFCCSENDRALLESLVNDKNVFIKNFDFRHQTIMSRQINRENPIIIALENWLSDTPKDRRLICGSFWASEVFLFNEFDGVDKKTKVLIAPHQLKGSDCQDLINRLKEKFCSLFVLSHPSQLKDLKNHEIVINLLPNILCESYCLFGQAYVGGGFGRSVHSLLEPFWAGCQIYLGPKTHRSTEYDFINEIDPLSLHILNRESRFSFSLVFEQSEKKEYHQLREKYFLSYHQVIQS